MAHLGAVQVHCASTFLCVEWAWISDPSLLIITNVGVGVLELPFRETQFLGQPFDVTRLKQNSSYARTLCAAPTTFQALELPVEHVVLVLDDSDVVHTFFL